MTQVDFRSLLTEIIGDEPAAARLAKAIGARLREARGRGERVVIPGQGTLSLVATAEGLGRQLADGDGTTSPRLDGDGTTPSDPVEPYVRASDGDITTPPSPGKQDRLASS